MKLAANLMRTVGTVLKNARIEKGVTLAQVEKQTKIKEKVLAQIETDSFFEFSSFGHVQGLVKNYGEFLGQDTNYLTALLRRQVAAPTPQKLTSFNFPKFILRFSTPTLVAGTLVLVFAYLIFQLISLKSGPTLEVFEPVQGQVVNFNKIQIAGVAEPEAQVTVNGQRILTNVQGEFTLEFELHKGVNLIEIVAKKGERVERKIVRTVELTD